MVSSHTWTAAWMELKSVGSMPTPDSTRPFLVAAQDRDDRKAVLAGEVAHSPRAKGRFGGRRMLALLARNLGRQNTAIWLFPTEQSRRARARDQ
jgi:hypothetical protein